MEFTIQELREILEHILEELTSGNIERHDWYAGLFTGVESSEAEELASYESSTYATVAMGEKRYSREHVLAIEAIRYPELHDLMRQIVLKITEYGEKGRFKQIWENEEVQAGGAFARELAMYSKEDISLYLRYIRTNDLDHEVYQTYDMLAVCSRWDYSIETIPLLLFRHDYGQHQEIYGSNICKTVDEAQGYLDAAIAYFQEEWDFDPNSEDDIDLTMEWVDAVFGQVLELDEEQIFKFATEFVTQMAEDESPTIEDLLAAAKG